MPLSTTLHVGPHKTGSTAIQRALRVNRRRLRELGVLVPKAGMSGKGHHALVDYARGRKDEFNVQELAREVAGHSNVLISSENISNLKPWAMKRLRRALPGQDFKVVYYLRRVTDLWASHWQAIVRHGSAMTFHEYLTLATMTMAYDGQGALAVDQRRQLDSLAHAFGHDALHIVGYDLLRRRDRDIVDDLIRRASPSAADAIEVASNAVHASAPLWFVELVRALNQLHHEITGQRPSSALRMAVASDLAEGKITFAKDFEDLVAKHSTEWAFPKESITIRQLQDRVLSKYSDRISDDLDAVVPAYTDAENKTTKIFRFPIASNSGREIQDALLEYYRGLPDAAAGPGPRRAQRAAAGGPTKST